VFADFLKRLFALPLVKGFSSVVGQIRNVHRNRSPGIGRGKIFNRKKGGGELQKYLVFP
jgi:hypothetical protein